jgi:hypothetical protein
VKYGAERIALERGRSRPSRHASSQKRESSWMGFFNHWFREVL